MVFLLQLKYSGLRSRFRINLHSVHLHRSEFIFFCHKCNHQTALSWKFCSTEQALDRTNKQFVTNCTAHDGIVACYSQATYKFGILTSFKRDCATPSHCWAPKLIYHVNTSGDTTNYTSIHILLHKSLLQRCK